MVSGFSRTEDQVRLKADATEMFNRTNEPVCLQSDTTEVARLQPAAADAIMAPRG